MEKSNLGWSCDDKIWVMITYGEIGKFSVSSDHKPQKTHFTFHLSKHSHQCMCLIFLVEKTNLK